ncbi:MAG: glycosyltransferase [Gemmatimonadetes bacterium]|nr:glycosyltransferase [Gemmatimonadota bacterium]
MTPAALAGAGVAIACAMAIVAIWAAYPLVMRLLARARSRDRRASRPEALPDVSVILATREGPDAVGPRVANLLDTAYPADRLVVVVAIAADADPKDYAADDPRVRVVVGDPPGGKWANLNAGVRAATGEVLVFADTAQRFEPGTIPALVTVLATEDVAAVTGWLALPTGVPAVVRAYWAMERALRRDEAVMHSSVGVTGAVWALRRTLWEPLPPDLILDDLYTPMRLVLGGHRIAVSDAAIARDTRAPRRDAEFQRKVRTLTGVFQVCALLPGVLRPGRNPLWAQFVVHKLLRMATPWLVLLALAGGAVALGALLLARGMLGDALLGALLASVVVMLSPARRLVLGAWDALHLQFAPLRATQNALRGRWNVWH